MASPAVTAAVEKLLRLMPRNPDIIALGELIKVERLAVPASVAPTDVETTAPVASTCPACETRRQAKAATMRRYRSKGA